MASGQDRIKWKENHVSKVTKIPKDEIWDELQNSCFHEIIIKLFHELFNKSQITKLVNW